MGKGRLFFQSNRRVLIVLGLSLLSIFCFNVTKNGIGSELFGWLRLWKYLSLLIIFASFYILFLKYKRVVLANITLVALLVLILELTLFFLLGMPSAFKKDFKVYYSNHCDLSRKVGFYYEADSVYRDLKMAGSDTVCNVRYSIDHWNKRMTPGFDSSKSEYALFFGCSLGFGFGLDDDQTFPFQVQKLSTNINAYNFCISGAGTNQMLALLQGRNLAKQVHEKQGSAYYVFFWDHIYRAIGTMSRYTDWLHNAPYYKMVDGKLVRNKMFKDGRPVISTLYEQLYQTNIVKYFKTDFPLRLNDSHFELVSEMILQMKKNYEKQFKNDHFYLVFYPNYESNTKAEMKTFLSYLKKKKIEIIDLSNKIEYGSSYTLLNDAHPNANTNALMASYLLEERKKQ